MKNAADFISCDEITDLDATGFSYWGCRVKFKSCEDAILACEGSQWASYVGWRDSSSNPPHLEFPAGDRRVVVTFPADTFWNRLFHGNEFMEFQSKLDELGWQTIDLS